ncbi:unnamed protein product [Scytosiphon promiscuus]
MGAHRRRFVRQRNTANRRRGTKSPDAVSLEGGDGSCSLRSWDGTFDSSGVRTASPSPRGDLAPGTLIRRPTVSDGGGVREAGEDSGRVGSLNDGAKEKPVPPPYHPDAACAEMAGFSGRLSSSHEKTPQQKTQTTQQAALGGLRQWLTRESVDLAPLLGDGRAYPPEEEDLALLRFLRHNSWDVELTRAQLEASLAWRVDAGIAAATQREPWEVSKCASAETFEQLCRTHYPHYTLGTDRRGRPVLVQKYGNFDLSKLKDYTTLDGLLLYHAWEQEKNAELLRRATARKGYLVETYAMIMDFKGMSMTHVNRDFLWLLREISEMDRKHYPGRGGDIYVINTPPLFGLVWQGIRGFLATQASVHIFGGEKDWKAALAEAIDPAVLPHEYGGTAPPLAETPLLPDVHCALQREGAAVLPAAAAAAAAAAADVARQGAETDAAAPMTCEKDATLSSMRSILQCFSSVGGDGTCRSLEGASEDGGGGGGGWFSFTNPAKERGGAEGGGVSRAPCTAVPEDPPSPRVVIVRHRGDGYDGSANREKDDGWERDHEEDDLTAWIMDAVPGARMAAAVAGTVAGATLGATLGAAGFAAGVAEAVLPHGVWAEGVQAFQTAQLLGGWALGHQACQEV